jgi:hypothetical protein
VKALKDPRQLFGGDTDPGVADGQLGRLLDGAQADDDLALERT